MQCSVLETAYVVPDLKSVRTEIARHVEILIRNQAEKPAVDRGAIEAKLKRLGQLYKDGMIEDSEYARERDALRELLVATEVDIPPVDIDGARKLLNDIPSLLEGATNDELRGIFRLIFTRFYAEHRELKAITPTKLYLPLVGAIKCWFGVADGTCHYHRAKSTETSDKSRPIIGYSRHKTAKVGALMSANAPWNLQFACLLISSAPDLTHYDPS